LTCTIPYNYTFRLLTLVRQNLPWFYPTEKQTVEFNIKARVEFKSKTRARMGVWQAMEMLNTLVDESDPDVSPYIPLLRSLYFFH